MRSKMVVGFYESQEKNIEGLSYHLVWQVGTIVTHRFLLGMEFEGVTLERKIFVR